MEKFDEHPRKKIPRILRFPTTFEIALLISAVVFFAIWIFPPPEIGGDQFVPFQILTFWKNGFWELLEFTMQMILILVLGFAIATSPPCQKLLVRVVAKADTNTKAVMFTGISAIIGGYLNWGFGLILGAIVARQMGDHASKVGLSINYPLVGASGYLGMLVWHGGLSASSSLKAAEAGHFLEKQIGVIPVSETLFSTANMVTNLTLVLGLLVLMYVLSKRSYSAQMPKGVFRERLVGSSNFGKAGLGAALGILILLLCISDFILASGKGVGFIDLNYINFVLLGMGLLVYGDVEAYSRSVSKGLSISTDILIQFPFYAGILGMMKYSGFLELISEWSFRNITPDVFPMLAFGTAALVNFFIPSGGGQWAVQGPIFMEAGKRLGVDPADLILAFSYGDQVTNMLQPFWALPLLSITGIPAKSLLRYTFYFFLLAVLVFLLGIWVYM